MIVSVAICGFAILYESGDSGNPVIWGIMVAVSLIRHILGLNGVQETKLGHYLFPAH